MSAPEHSNTKHSRRARTSEGPRPFMTLRFRMLVFLAAIIALILLGQTLISLSSEITDLDHHIETEGTVLAQSVASSAAALWEGPSPARFDHLLERLGVRYDVDLIEAAVIDREGRVLAHTDLARVGTLVPKSERNVFAVPRSSPGLPGLFRHDLQYAASAPVLRGSMVLGFVSVRFRSSDVAERAGKLLGSAAAMGLFWMLVAAGIGTFYVHRITKPLAKLTEAAGTAAEDDLGAALESLPPPREQPRDEVEVLQRTFGTLLSSLHDKEEENDRLLAELQQANATLRQRVDEVTADLRETNAYVESVIRCVDEGIVTCDQAGVIVQSNVGVGHHLRELGDARPGLPIATLIPAGEELAEAVEAALRHGTTSHLALTRQIAAGGSDEVEERNLVFRVSPLRAADGDPLGAVTTIIDETERHQLEARLRRHDRLASLGTIAAGLAHELGNYMHAINGFSSLLLRALPKGDPTHADALAIHEENGRAIDLLERFLLFARPSAFGLHPEPLDALVRNALGMCVYKAREAGVEILEELALGETEVWVDSRLITQVFVNLVLNALEAVADSPTRQVRVTSWLVDDAVVGVSFADSGEGIDPADIERIFDPFFTTKSAHGTGLGLSIAHQIIARHGGSLSVTSKLGQGAIFSLTLPQDGRQGGAT